MHQPMQRDTEKLDFECAEFLSCQMIGNVLHDLLDLQPRLVDHFVGHLLGIVSWIKSNIEANERDTQYSHDLISGSFCRKTP